MPRIDKVNEEVRHCLASLLMTVKDPRVRGVVSIVRADTTPDFKQSRIYVSVLNDSDSKEVLKGLKSASGYLRRELGRTLGLRNTPELIFLKDDSIKHGARILDLLQTIKPASGSAASGSDASEVSDNDERDDNDADNS